MIIRQLKTGKMVYTIQHVQITAKGEEPKAWKQFFMSFLASIPYLTYGVETTALASSAHAGHFLPASGGIPWSTTAMVVSAALSAPFYCYFADRYGRKSGIYFISLMQGASCIPLFLSTSFVSEIILHILAGIAAGGLFTVLPTYIREINNDEYRALSLSLIMVMSTAGYMMELSKDLEAIIFLMVGLIVAQFLALLVLIETPSYLVMVGKLDKAKQNISRLFCLPIESEKVSVELQALKDENDRVSLTKINLLYVLKTPLYRDATKIGIVLYTSMVLCGSVAFLDQDKVLAQLKMAENLEKTMVLTCMLAGSVCCFLLVQFVERKIILTSGFVIMVFSIGVLAIYTQADLTLATLRWVPVTFLGVLLFGFGVTWGLPLVIMCEIYNFRIRATMLSVLFTYSQILKLIHIHTFPYIEDYMGLYTTLYIFAGINMYASVYTIFAVPELKKKTVRQIEKQLKRVPLLEFNTVKV